MANWNVELPCQIGDTVYFVSEDYMGNKQIKEVKVSQIKISDIGIYVVDDDGFTYSAERLYFSKKEAIKEMFGKDEGK